MQVDEHIGGRGGRQARDAGKERGRRPRRGRPGGGPHLEDRGPGAASGCACTRSRWAASSSTRWARPCGRCSSATRGSRRSCWRANALVNDYDDRLDSDSLTFIALQQPVANDLRMARAVARVGLELERVGRRVEEDRAIRAAARLGFARRPGGRGRPLPAAHGGSLDGDAAQRGARTRRGQMPRWRPRCWRATRNSTASTRRRCGS